MDWNAQQMVEVLLKSPDDFLKCRETLTRIGVASRSEQKPKVNVLDKVKRGYNFDDDEFDDDDEVLAELTSGALRDTAVSGKRADAGKDSVPAKSSESHNKSLNSTKTNNEMSDVIELESYEDSFDDDF